MTEPLPLLPKDLINDLEEGDRTAEMMELAQADRPINTGTMGQAFSSTQAVSATMARPDWAFSSVASFARFTW